MALVNIHQSVSSLLPFHCLIIVVFVIMHKYKTFSTAVLTIDALA